jgi:hypothetical protein
VRVAVQHEVGAVFGHRDGEAIASEQDADPLWLACERRLDRRIVEENDAQVAVHESLESLRDRLDVARGLRVHASEQRLAEVGQHVAGKAADESLHADDAQLEPLDAAGAPRPVEHTHARVLEHLGDLDRPAGVPVVVPEDGEHGDREPATGIGDHPRLLDFARRREVAREQHDVGLVLDPFECSVQSLSRRFRRVHVARCGNADHRSRCCTSPGNGNGETVPEPTFEELIEALKAAAGVLRAADVEFVLGGGLAAWARGGPKSEHDVDLLVRPDDVDRALEAFDRAGMRTERPPEGWLVKTWHENGTLIDLIYRPSGGAITDETIERAPTIEVMALRLKVSPLEDVFTTKLLALTEQEPDYGDVLELARALREQVDWDEVRARTHSSPFARAFFTLTEELGIVPAADATARSA